MRKGVVEVSKWLKKAKEEALPGLTWEGRDSTTPQEALEYIRAHWQKTWDKRGGMSEGEWRAKRRHRSLRTSASFSSCCLSALGALWW